MPNFIAIACLEVGEKFSVGGVGWWWGGGGISTPRTKSNQLKLGQVDVELGCDNYFVFEAVFIPSIRFCRPPADCQFGMSVEGEPLQSQQV